MLNKNYTWQQLLFVYIISHYFINCSRDNYAHTWIILNLKVSWWRALFPSAMWVFASMETKLTLRHRFKNSNKQIDKSIWETCPLTFTSKFTIRSCEELDSGTCETRTPNLSFGDNLALVSSVVGSLDGKSDVNPWFLLLSWSTSAIRELNVSFAAISIDALSF